MADKLHQQRHKSRWPKVLTWFSVLVLVAARPAGPGDSWHHHRHPNPPAFIALRERLE